ncbi:MAG: hypothetical protein AAFU79_21295, partial [Myxococcota bacterium]
MAALDPDWLIRVYKAALDADLPKQRDALVSSLPSRLRQLMEGQAAPAAQQLSDLNVLNDVAQSGDSEPLLLWLRLAEILAAKNRNSVTVMAEASAIVAAPTTTPADPPVHTPTENPPAASGPIDKRELMNFLTSAFSVSELRRLISLGNLSSVEGSIAWGNSLRQVVFDL